MSKIAFRGYNRIKFPSLKLGKTIFCQSLLLRDYLLYLEYDENIEFYGLKPFKIAYKVYGKGKTFQPHLLLRYLQNRPKVVWIKPTLDKEDHQQFIQFVSNFLDTKGFDFAVVCTNEIRKEPLFSNLKLLRRYLRSDLTFATLLLCIEFFEGISDPLLGDLIDFFSYKGENVQTVYSLLAQKLIETDIFSSHITINSSVTLKSKFPIPQNRRFVI